MVMVQEDEMVADICVEKFGNNELDVTFNLTIVADNEFSRGNKKKPYFFYNCMYINL